MSIVIKENEFRQIISDLDKEIENLKEAYDDVNREAKKIDGTGDMWKGDTQRAVYNYYKEVSGQFPDNIERLESLSTYLKNTLENYINGEHSINSDVDTNSDNLNINE